MKVSPWRWLPYLIPALIAFSGCRSMQYSVMEKFGVEKRDILVDRVEDARDAQEETKEQFSSALEEFSALINFDGGDLEDIYDRLSSELQASEASAERISDRIDALDDVAKDLFAEWNDELDQYENESLRRQSEAQLEQTIERYDQLIARMRNAESKVEPVLRAFRDQVLFLKHNLNANAIAALESEAERIRIDVRELIEDMESAIEEANAFIESMR